MVCQWVLQVAEIPVRALSANSSEPAAVSCRNLSHASIVPTVCSQEKILRFLVPTQRYTATRKRHVADCSPSDYLLCLCAAAIGKADGGVPVRDGGPEEAVYGGWRAAAARG